MPVFTTLSKNAIALDPSVITDVLLAQTLGLSFDPTTLTTIGGASSIGLYDGSLTALGIGAGILLTTGTMPGTSNSAGYFGISNNMVGDPDLDAVVNKVFHTMSYDATSLSVSFTVTDPTMKGVSFNIVFGSDEFPEWVNAFVDIAAIFVNGVNVAYFNHDINSPLSVIGSNLANNYFINNTGNLTTPSFGGVARPGVASTLPIEYDGVSAPLTVFAPVHMGINTLKIAIADTGDHIYDSGLFISNMRGTDVPVSGITLPMDGTEADDDLQGTDASESGYGYGGNDTIDGHGGDDIIQAGAGDDLISGGAGNDYLDGEAGSDTAVYAGASSDYTVVKRADGSITVTDKRLGRPDGADRLANMEYAQFADTTLDLAAMAPTGLTTATDSLAPVTAGAIEDGATASADAFANMPSGFDDSEWSVVNLPADLPDGVTYDAASHRFSLDPTGAAYQSLAAGQQVTVSVDYAIQDGVVQTPASVAFIVSGTNDAPVVSVALAAAATEDGAAVTVDALANATDIDQGAVLTVTTLPAAAETPATTPDPAADPSNSNSNGKHGGADETGTTPTTVPTPDLGLPAGVTFDAATNRFSIDPTDPAYQSLAAGQTTQVVVNYGISDGTAVTATSLTFTVTGTNDAPVVSGPATGVTVQEDGSVGSYHLAGLLSATQDVDQGDQLSVSIVDADLPESVTHVSTPDEFVPEIFVPAQIIVGPVWGGYTPEVTVIPAHTIPAHVIPGLNDLTIDPSHPRYQALAQGESEDVEVQYTVTDGDVSVAATAIFHVVGTNDAPIVAGIVTGTATEDGGPGTIDALANATDIDHGAVLSVTNAPVVGGISGGDSANDQSEAPPPGSIPPIGAPLDPATLPAGVSFDAATNQFSIDPTNAAYQHLSAGQTQQVVVDYGVTDGIAVTAGQAVFTVTGTNDAPTVSGPVTGLIVNEDGTGGYYDLPALIAQAQDIDQLDVLNVTLDPADLPDGVTYVVTPEQVEPAHIIPAHVIPAGPRGTSWGGYIYPAQYIPDQYVPEQVTPSHSELSIDPTNAVFQSLAQGEEREIVVNYKVTDGTVSADAQAVFVVNGMNDAPIVAGPVIAAATEDGVAVTVDGLANATDVDHGAVLSLVAAPPPVTIPVGSGTDSAADLAEAAALAAAAPVPILPFDPTTLPAGVTFDAATHSFTLDASDPAYQHLAQGETTTVTVNYGVADGFTVTAARVVFTVTGTNDVPIVTTPQAFSAIANTAAFTIDPLANVTDIDTRDSLRLVAAPLGSGIRTAFIPGGYYMPDIQITQFDPSAAVFRSLAAGQVGTYTWNYDVTDGTATVHDSAVFTVTGVNDAPIVANPVVAVMEDAAVVTVDALAHATDADADAMSVVNVQAVLPPGVTYDAATHSFRIDPADASFQQLAAGESQSVLVSYGVTDGTVTTAASLWFTVTGTNDAPVISAPVTSTPNEGSGIVAVNPLGNASDVDAHQGLQLTGLQANLPAGVTYDAINQRLLIDTDNQAFNSLSIGESLDVVVTYNVFDAYVSLPTSTTFSVQGKNDAPVVAGVVQGGTVAEDSAPLIVSLLAATTDVDHLDVLKVDLSGSNTVTAMVTSGNWAAPVTFTVANNQLTLNPGQFKTLSANEVVDLTFNYLVTDGNSVTGTGGGGGGAGGAGGNAGNTGSIAASAHVVIAGKNNAPTGITLSATHVAENTVGGSVVAQLAPIDPDRADTFTYQLLGDAKGFFAISGNTLVVAAGAAIDYEAVTSDAISLRVTDSAGGSATSNVTIAIDNKSGVTLNGGSANDIYTTTSAVATTSEEDTVNGNNGDDTIDGGAGADTLNGGSGNDTLIGGADDDILTGGAGADTVSGGAGNDRIIISGSEGTGDVVNGGAGTDTLVASGSASMVLSGFNATTASVEVIEGNGKGISGTSAGETFDLSGINLFAGSGMGFLDSGAGADIIIGSGFADDLRGGAGADTIIGGLGADILTGGNDADIFKFAAGFGKDIIADFSAGSGSSHDVIDFSGVFADFVALKAAATQLNSKDTLITAGADSITLKNVTVGSLLAVDFAFHA